MREYQIKILMTWNFYINLIKIVLKEDMCDILTCQIEIFHNSFEKLSEIIKLSTLKS